jgi:prevent-host-death family protein
MYVTTIVIWQDVMRKIQLKDAKANLSAVVDQATRGKPSVITRHGKPEAVVLGFADWERLSRVPSFGRLLMFAPLEAAATARRHDLTILSRNAHHFAPMGAA